jgi:4-amino-4-deoxy-L-arabinose transferase-like glycosyltransferase
VLAQQKFGNLKRAKAVSADAGWLLPIILVGFALRLYRLGAQSLWYDETVSAFLAGQSIPDLIAHTARDIHPPAYYLLLHLWTGLAGQTEFALAFFSLFFGILILPLTYRLAGLVANKTVGFWAALLVAISPFHIWYSQEVRMYTLGAALGLATAVCAVLALHHTLPIAQDRKRRPGVFWLGYLIFALLGLYSLYYFAFLLVVLNLLFLVKTVRPILNRPALLALLGINGLVLVGYLPWLPVAWRQAVTPPVPPWRDPEAFSVGAVLLKSWSALSLGQSVDPATVWPILLLTLALLLLGYYYLPGSSSRFGPAGLVAYTFGPLLLIYLLSFITPLYHVRYLFIYSPPFYILLAAGLLWLARHTRFWLSLSLTLILVGACFYSIYQLHFNPRYRADDYRAAVQFIREHWQPGDVILANAGYTYPAFLYYAGMPDLDRQRLVPYRPPSDLSRPLLLQTGTVNGNPQLGWADPRSDFYAMSEADTLVSLEALSHTFSRLWLLRAYDTVTDPAGLIRTWLARHTIPIEDQLFSGQSNIRAQGFLLPHPPPPATEPVRFEDGMALAHWHLPNGSWRPGQVIPVKLWWLATAPPDVDYKMSLKLWSSQAELVAQGRDQWPVGTLYRATDWPTGQTVYHPVQLRLPPDLPAGHYWLNVELYHPETLQSLARLDGADPVVTLGPVIVP